MPEIREQFTWGQNYDENNNKLPETIYRPLKDLTSSHITGIIRYLIDRMTINEEFNIYCIGQQTKAFLIIFTHELENRLKMEKKFKHKITGEIITYKDGVIKSGTFVLDM